ncbi:transketolase [Actinopolymorpha cephalotaxi]|uniref:Transketolase n=1 Tax=Actinopolymorpha cephalotaxi TaxID=504797 RepID=A0A1I2QWW9_9ACTN|nr:transketolase [Actinopolymorpha cephalotaxi]NYH82457.1 transketolase [Actinopolymorpha cephalotaxi]SFG32530.1 transketolase [Actinopolymorpha cephalotaxi]
MTSSDALAPLDWTDVDKRAVDTIRALAMDAVEKSGNGHPGTAMSLAPAAYLLFQRLMRYDPADPDWIARDRFVLSAGHTSLTLYIQLFFAGLLDLEDLKHFRKWGSRTPGHPEHGHTAGVETTTGPLGQGLGNAVGMAMAARRERGLLDPDAPAGTSPFDHRIFTIVSDGDIEEGISHEVSSLAAHQKLGHLIALYDENKISIEDDTTIALSENVAERYDAYGWHVQTVEWKRSDDYVEDVQALYDAYQKAIAETDRPSLIVLRTIIAWPAPHAQNTGKAHGAALGSDEVAATKRILGFDPEKSFVVDDNVLEHVRKLRERGGEAHREWTGSFSAWRTKNPERAQLLDRMRERRLPEGWTDRIPTFEAGKAVATRKASGAVISALAPALPELWGGSADLAESNNTTPDGEPSFIPPEYATKEFAGDWYGRVLHFGIREHGMGAILNGIALHGGTRPYGATFLVFSDYMRPSVRLAALMQLPVLYVWTHDSIGLGEDGPTHQPVEHLAALRAIPGLDVIRPGDANETAAAWQFALDRPTSPKGFALSRQNLPTFDRSEGSGFAPASEVGRGGYVLVDAPGDAVPDVILIATGSELQMAVAAREQLAEEGVGARVVSMPCVEWFDAQEKSYRDTVLPPTVRARVCVEAGIAQPWYRFAGDAGRIVSLEHFGASADYQTLFEEFGFTAGTVAQAARESLAAVRA